MTEDNLSKEERKEVVKEINKKLHQKALEEAKAFKNEFKKQTSTAIIAAFGLIIALAWKDVITNLISKLTIPTSYGLIVSAILITFVSVIGIYLISKWGKTEDKKI